MQPYDIRKYIETELYRLYHQSTAINAQIELLETMRDNMTNRDLK